MKAKDLSIAHIHWGFPPIVGGVETHLAIVLPEMVKLGHKVGLLTGAVEGVENRYEYEGVDIWRTFLMDLNWLCKKKLEDLKGKIYEVFSSFLEETKPDVIHCHNMHYFSKVHAKAIEELAKKRSIPIILTAHNVWDDLIFLELSYNIDWTHIIAVSHYIKKEIIGIGIDDRKITVIHHGIDQEKLNPNVNSSKILAKYPQLKNREVVFHPARIGLAKGCDVSIKALNLLVERHPDIILILSGSKNIVDWEQSQQKDIIYLLNLIRHFKLENNVLLGVYSLGEMPELYAVSDVCVYPSTSQEPFGLTMLEAMSMAKPMIVTNSGGMPEIIINEANGFIVPMRDFETLAARINQLLEDDKLKRRLGYTGRQIVESQYTKERVTNNILSIYKRFL
jgi:hypothetical protein